MSKIDRSDLFLLIDDSLSDAKMKKVYKEEFQSISNHCKNKLKECKKLKKKANKEELTNAENVLKTYRTIKSKIRKDIKKFENK